MPKMWLKKGLQFDHKDPNNREFKIGKLLNYSKELVFKEIKKCQLLCEKCHFNKSINEGSLGKNRLKGVDSPKAKLTEKEVKTILATHDTNTNIAKNFNVSRGTIWHIKNNRTWKHINL